MPDDHTPSALERISAPWLVRLSLMPRWLFLIVLGSVLFAGLYLDNAVGGVLLLLLALFLAWLASLGWSRVSPLGPRPAAGHRRRARLRGGRQVL